MCESYHAVTGSTAGRFEEAQVLAIRRRAIAPVTASAPQRVEKLQVLAICPGRRKAEPRGWPLRPVHACCMLACYATASRDSHAGLPFVRDRAYAAAPNAAAVPAERSKRRQTLFETSSAAWAES